MSDMNFDFWKTDQTEVDLEGAKSAEVEKFPPQFSEDESLELPDKFTSSWVRSQLAESVWKKVPQQAKISPALIAEMANAAAKTPSKRGLMARFGMGPKSFYIWEAKAAQGIEPYALWHRCVMHGFSKLEEELLDNVRGHAISDWKAAAWYLARLNREEFGEKQATTQISVQGEGGSKVTVNRITEDDAMAIARIMGEIGALPSGTSDNVIEGEVVEGD
jgi:hypothetical protein